MLRLSNIRIGTKLAIMSGLGVLLVAAMIGLQMWGNAAVSQANGNVIRRALLVQNAVDAKASIRGLQIGVRDIRLARSLEDLEKAKTYLGAREKSANEFVDRAIQLSSIPTTIERLKGIKLSIGMYSAGAKEIAANMTEMLALQSKQSENSVRTAEAADRIAALDRQAVNIARERTLPMAEQMEVLANAVVASVIERMNVSAGDAVQEMAFSERLGLGVGAVVIFVLIGSAVFGALAIGRPLRKMAGVLGELTNDRIVDVPFTTRGDEIGDIAKATEVFKQSIAEKVINLRVRSALDVVKSNVMVADADYNIMYMNTTLQEMMREADAELRKVLPNFDSSKLLGANMDVFHKNPAHQRKLLDSLTGNLRIPHHGRQPEIPPGGHPGR